MGLLIEGTGYEIAGVNRGDVYNEIVIKTINTVDDGDTIAITLKDYGISATGLMGVHGYEHTTPNSIVVQADPTTVVASGVLTLTVSGSNDNNQRYYVIRGFAVPNPAASL